MQKITKYVYTILLKQANCHRIKTVQLSDHLFDDLDLDSLDIIHILSLLEKKYNIIFPDRYIDCMQSVYELIYMLMFCIINRKLSHIIDLASCYCTSSWRLIIQSLKNTKQKFNLREQKIFTQHKACLWHELINFYQQEVKSLCNNLFCKKMKNRKEITLLLQTSMFKINKINE